MGTAPVVANAVAPAYTWPAWAMVLASVGGAAAAVALLAVTPRRLLVQNYAGRIVPAVLGSAFVVAVALATLVIGWVAPPRSLTAVTATVLVAMVLAAAAGLVDDLTAGTAKGLRGHLESLLKGRPTTGILKFVIGVAAGVMVAAILGGGTLRVVASAVLLAACTNVWNALDVVPGRALKWGIVVLLAVLAPAWQTDLGLPVAAALGAAAGVLPFDLLERGMLGDAGSNPLGLVVGAGLAVALPTPAVVAAAGAALLLQVAAETVTISRLVQSAPPLRSFDRLGRRGPMGQG